MSTSGSFSRGPCNLQEWLMIMPSITLQTTHGSFLFRTFRAFGTKAVGVSGASQKIAFLNGRHHLWVMEPIIDNSSPSPQPMQNNSLLVRIRSISQNLWWYLDTCAATVSLSPFYHQFQIVVESEHVLIYQPDLKKWVGTNPEGNQLQLFSERNFTCRFFCGSKIAFSFNPEGPQGSLDKQKWAKFRAVLFPDIKMKGHMLLRKNRQSIHMKFVNGGSSVAFFCSSGVISVKADENVKKLTVIPTSKLVSSINDGSCLLATEGEHFQLHFGGTEVRERGGPETIGDRWKLFHPSSNSYVRVLKDLSLEAHPHKPGTLFRFICLPIKALEAHFQVKDQQPIEPDMTPPENLPSNLSSEYAVFYRPIEYAVTLERLHPELYEPFVLSYDDKLDDHPYNDPDVPSFVRGILSRLEGKEGTEGIFRVCGLVTTVASLTKSIDSGMTLTNAIQDLKKPLTTEDLTSLLKSYFRSLPEILIPPKTFELFEAALASAPFAQLSECNDENDEEDEEDGLVMNCSSSLVTSLESRFAESLRSSLSVYQFKLLKCICWYCWKVQQKADLSLMSASNLSLIFCPALVHFDASLFAAGKTNLQLGILDFMFINYHDIFVRTKQ